MLTWLLPNDILGWLPVIGMIAALVAATLLTSPLMRMALAVTVVLMLGFHIHRLGVTAERARWQEKADRETARQKDVNRKADDEAARDIAKRKENLDRLDRESEKVDAEAARAPDADRPVLGLDAIERLNRLR